MERKLSVKDLVSIGVFVVIYFVVMFGVGMMGIVPILFLVYPTILGLVASTIPMLIMSKIQKPFALFIFGIISPLIMFIMGHTIVLVIISAIVLLLAEFCRYLGNYKSFKFNALANGFFSMWIAGSLSQMVFAHDYYVEMCNKMMPAEYAINLERLLSPFNLALVFLGAFVGGLIGAVIAKKILKKHFEKAGII